MVQSDQGVDITDWHVRRGKYQKPIGELLLPSKDHFPDGNMAGSIRDGVRYPETGQIYLPRAEGNEGVLFVQKSPVSLPDSGGILELLDGDENVLDTFTYPKTKKGSRNKRKYAEIWQRVDNQIFPQLLWEDDDIPLVRESFTTVGPTSPDQVELRISEVGLDRYDKRDFIELKVTQAPPDGANIWNLQISQNGTEVLRIDQDYWVQEGDWLLVYFGLNPLNPPLQGGQNTPTSLHIFPGTGKQGLANANGTLAVRLWNNTSWEGVEDFWCWRKTKPSQAMVNRIAKVGVLSSDECAVLPDIVTDESLAMDNRGQFFRHYLGSPGNDNYHDNPLNQPPQPQIRVQSHTSTSLNLTGDNSHDPNGNHDIRTWQWEYRWLGESDNWQPLAMKANPATFSFSRVTELSQEACEHVRLQLQLRLTDYGGLLGENTKTFPLEWIDDRCRIREPGWRVVGRRWRRPTSALKSKSIESDEFFATYRELWAAGEIRREHKRARVDEFESKTNFSPFFKGGFTHRVQEKSTWPLLTKREQFFYLYPMTRDRLEKNIGWVTLMSYR